MTPSLPAANSPVNRTILRFRQILQSPKLFGALIAILLIDGILALVIPQQPAAVNTPSAFVVWVSNLPPLFRQGYESFNRVGLFAIFHSLWFWLPAALAMWMSLLALAEAIPAGWVRLRSPLPAAPMPPPHPRSVIHQKTIRLAAPKDSGVATASAPALETLTHILRHANFKVAINGLTVMATRQRWGWTRPVALRSALFC